jgi:hypothetical protein
MKSSLMVDDGTGAETSMAPAHLHALETVYFAAVLEEARVFQVVEQLASMFGRGLLPISSGPAAELLYAFWKTDRDRLTADQRATVYARAFGFAGGAPGVVLNREFDELWLRFLPTVGMFAAELELPREVRSVGREEVRQVALELAINLSEHGSGFVFSAAQDLRRELREMVTLLTDVQIESALGVRGMWQVIDRVTATELGGRPNLSRSCTRAQTGALIIRWLANRPKLLVRPGSVFLKEDGIRLQRGASIAHQKSHPTDFDLVVACEQWLAVTGTQSAESGGDVEMEEPTVSFG